MLTRLSVFVEGKNEKHIQSQKFSIKCFKAEKVIGRFIEGASQLI